jgi:D-3-phosphoglycerate dehydrogenase
MKPESFLINTSRGGVVDQGVLKKALKEGTIAGAALDVYEEEPPSDLELLSLPNLFCTPHVGGSAVESIRAMGLSAIKHLEDFFGVENCQYVGV